MREFEGLKVPCDEGMSCGAVDCKGVDCESCIFAYSNNIKLAKYIATHKTPLTELYVPFGLLSEDKQMALKESEVVKYRWSNIEFYSQIRGEFTSCALGASWGTATIYRLDPKWSPEDPKEARKRELIAELEELGAVENGKVIK